MMTMVATVMIMTEKQSDYDSELTTTVMMKTDYDYDANTDNLELIKL